MRRCACRRTSRRPPRETSRERRVADRGRRSMRRDARQSRAEARTPPCGRRRGPCAWPKRSSRRGVALHRTADVAEQHDAARPLARRRQTHVDGSPPVDQVAAQHLRAARATAAPVQLPAARAAQRQRGAMPVDGALRLAQLGRGHALERPARGATRRRSRRVGRRRSSAGGLVGRSPPGWPRTSAASALISDWPALAGRRGRSVGRRRRRRLRRRLRSPTPASPEARRSAVVGLDLLAPAHEEAAPAARTSSRSPMSTSSSARA